MSSTARTLSGLRPDTSDWPVATDDVTDSGAAVLEAAAPLDRVLDGLDSLALPLLLAFDRRLPLSLPDLLGVDCASEASSAALLRGDAGSAAVLGETGSNPPCASSGECTRIGRIGRSALSTVGPPPAVFLAASLSVPRRRLPGLSVRRPLPGEDLTRLAEPLSLPSFPRSPRRALPGDAARLSLDFAGLLGRALPLERALVCWGGEGRRGASGRVKAGECRAGGWAVSAGQFTCGGVAGVAG